MKLPIAAAFLLGFAATATLAQDNPFAAMKGKTKPGLYDYKFEMDMGQMPGMPPGMGKQSHSMQQCITPEDIDKGEAFNKGRDPKGSQDCQIKDFKVVGNTASYKMDCAKSQMHADTTIIFGGDDFKGQTKMTMVQSGKPVTMDSKFEAKYLGACKK